ncbi:MAG: urea ABC transporter permease subunit UrtB [Alphaproteobacteria bacterium]|nr:urea ABC transporter permease subunit UrtB [Alphaproteobacteria bacterium]
MAGVPGPAAAQDEPVDPAYVQAVQALAEGGFRDKAEAIETLVELGDPRAGRVLAAMFDRRLFVREDAGEDAPALVIGETDAGDQVVIRDAITLEPLGVVHEDTLEAVGINNRLRRTLQEAIGTLQLRDPDPATRIAAAEALAGDRSDENAALLRDVLEAEEDPDVRDAITFALAQIDLGSDDRERRLAAIETLGGSFEPAVRGMLARVVRQNADGSYVEPDEEIRLAAEAALRQTERNLALVEFALNIFQGISLGSVLLLAAMGLAITFGVMGVINMAHGEMLMLGAYTTFVIQEIFRSVAPGLFDAYILVAIPAAFLVAGLVGVALEQGVIRFLYGRPLETLLATWGISLVLQQVVRLIFGAPNREVANPDWMQGGFELLGGAVITYNRLYIIIFALVVLALVALVLRYSRFGLQMRAVTQNRPMAACMGIRSGRVDALTFGLGSGIAGVGGVALSQIGNVSPNLGQSYIVDSFMVVVFGGVGSLWGVLVAAMSLGIINKFLEPYAGAMLGKIIVLVVIILFIQRRPRGLFALKGRAAEA